MDEDYLVFPVVVTVKSDKTVEKALDSRKLNDSCITMRSHMPNMVEFFNQSLVEIIRDQTVQFFRTKTVITDLDYPYGL